MSVAFACSFIRSGAVWAVASGVLMMLLCVLAIGVSGRSVHPVLPGAIEAALTSGRAELRSPAVVGTVAWLLLPVGAAVLRSVRGRTVSERR